MKVVNSTITGFGTGVYLYKSQVDIDESTISGNLGSGVLAGYFASFDIDESTISGNGGTGVSDSGSITNSTIANNGDGRRRGEASKVRSPSPSRRSSATRLASAAVSRDSTPTTGFI